jgi:pyruvate/2-oxoglutarate dehydrogenase complex dihydrolipoamide dehydrogenase (E3) component
MGYDFDMIAIGAGAAGLTAAGMAAVLGAKTALVEAGRLGGDCTWHGCIPSKSLLKAAKVAREMRTAGRYGLEPAAPEHDFARVIERVREIRRHVYEEADAPPHFERLGVEVIEGRARFAGEHTVEIGGRRVTSRYFVVATGSSPQVPPGDVLTNETLFEIDRLPGRLVVLGSGPVGIEMAQAFRRLGSEVTVVSRSAGILSRDDEELTAILLGRLRDEGIRFAFGAGVARVEGGVVHTRDGGSFAGDAVLAALGRRPNVDGLHLDAAGVAVNEKGIAVDRRCRTSAGHIYACGDVAGRHLFTHYAEHMAKVAVTNAILRIPARLDESRVPWTTFTDPELAHVGATAAELARQGVQHSVYRFPFAQLDRAVAESATEGMVKVAATRWGRVLGASILGANAGEMIAEYALAMRTGIRLDAISSTLHPYPTYALGNRRAADLYLMSKLSPGMVRWLQRIFRLRGGLEGVRALGSVTTAE